MNMTAMIIQSFWQPGIRTAELPHEMKGRQQPACPHSNLGTDTAGARRLIWWFALAPLGLKLRLNGLAS